MIQLCFGDSSVITFTPSFSYYILYFIKNVHPTLYPFLSECISLCCRMTGNVRECAAGFNRLHSNEPKNTQILKTIIPLITQLNEVIRRIVIIFSKFNKCSHSYKQQTSNCSLYKLPSSSRWYTHSVPSPPEKPQTSPLQYHFASHWCTGSVWTSGFVYSKLPETEEMRWQCFPFRPHCWSLHLSPLFIILCLSWILSSPDHTQCWNYSAYLFFCKPLSRTVPF